MNIFSAANLKKTIYYMKRNGLRKTIYAMRERVGHGGQPPYRRQPVSEQEKKKQREHAAAGFSHVSFSIVVPVYRTPESYLKEMIESVIKQTYPSWELILADATEDIDIKSVTADTGKPADTKAAEGTKASADMKTPAGTKASAGTKTAADAMTAGRIRAVAEAYGEERIRYFHLSSNDGIAENTNQGIAQAAGDYVGLLDHDDLLEENALYEMAAIIEREREKGNELQIIYSDEDKCNGDGTEYYDPNYKEDFNLDLLLSNNYICHFMVMKRELVQSLGLRKEYEGAQDFDLVLRGACGLLSQGQEKAIAHIPMMLYHWRCHTGSTAENPQSKIYAYEAGRKAVQAFADRKKWKAEAADTEHLGFYRLEYKGNIFESRPELAALGGPVVKRRRIAGGRMSPEGKVFYEGLPLSYSGYLHRAVLQQQAEALDIRNIEVREELWELFAEITGVEYKVLPGTRLFDVSALPDGTDYALLSIKLGEAFRQKGYKLLYMPERRKKRTCRPGRYRQSMNRCKTGRTRGY